MIQSAIFSLNAKEQGSEEANKLVDSFYTTLVNDKPVFENIDTQFNNLSSEIDYTMDWASFKSRINSMLNAQAWDIFELKKTKDYERAIKWSELSNIIEKENPYSLDTLGQLYFAVGRKTEAIAIQTKAVAIAKEMKISPEEFENALNEMKK
jgi:tetratricopeptide (TPR) repeat protein